MWIRSTPLVQEVLFDRNHYELGLLGNIEDISEVYLTLLSYASKEYSRWKSVNGLF